YTRKWDMQMAPSLCVHCGLGCNIIAGERYGTLRTITNRYNGQVNGYFLCDRGRFGYDFVNSPQRLRQPLLRRGATAEPVAKDLALQHVAALVRANAHSARTDARLLGIGSPRASLEANFTLRTLVGPERFCLGISEREHRLLSAVLSILRHGP